MSASLRPRCFSCGSVLPPGEKYCPSCKPHPVLENQLPVPPAEKVSPTVRFPPQAVKKAPSATVLKKRGFNQTVDQAFEFLCRISGEFRTQAKSSIALIGSKRGISFMVIILVFFPTLIGFLFGNGHFLSFGALSWMSFFLFCFAFCMDANEGVGKNIGFLASLKIDRESSPKLFWFRKKAIWLLKYVKKWTYFSAGITIFMAKLCTEFYVALLNESPGLIVGGYELFFSVTFEDLMDWTLYLAPIFGIVQDKKAQKKGEKVLDPVVSIGVTFFFLHAIFFFTGLYAGKAAFNHVYILFANPNLFLNDLFIVDYTQSHSFQLLQNTGPFFMLIFYLGLPFWMSWLARSKLKAIKKGYKSTFPAHSWRVLMYMAFFFLIIFSFLAVQEGWIILAFKMLSSFFKFLWGIIISIIKLFDHL